MKGRLDAGYLLMQLCEKNFYVTLYTIILMPTNTFIFYYVIALRG